MNENIHSLVDWVKKPGNSLTPNIIMERYVEQTTKCPTFK